jgi:cytochrome P450
VQVFGIPRRLADSPFLAEYYRMHHSKLLPQAISVMLRDYTTLVVEGIQTAVDANGPKTTPLQSFILPTVYNVGARALFGRAFPAESTYAPYLKFDEAVPLIATGLPAFLSRSPRRSFDEVIDVIESYLQQPHPDASELVRATEADAPATGWVRLLVAGCLRFALMPFNAPQSQRDIAHALACDLWAAETNTSWTAYWVIALMLQRPEGLASLHLELEHARAQWSLKHSDTSPVGHADSIHEWIMSSELPLLKSTIEETLRFTTYSFSNRTATRETTISSYKIKPGDNLLLMTRLTHLDEDIHQDAETFRPDRYINVSAKRFVKNGKPVPNHTMPWGGGTSMCEGR